MGLGTVVLTGALSSAWFLDAAAFSGTLTCGRYSDYITKKISSSSRHRRNRSSLPRARTRATASRHRYSFSNLRAINDNHVGHDHKRQSTEQRDSQPSAQRDQQRTQDGQSPTIAPTVPSSPTTKPLNLDQTDGEVSQQTGSPAALDRSTDPSGGESASFLEELVNRCAEATRTDGSLESSHTGSSEWAGFKTTPQLLEVRRRCVWNGKLAVMYDISSLISPSTFDTHAPLIVSYKLFGGQDL